MLPIPSPRIPMAIIIWASKDCYAKQHGNAAMQHRDHSRRDRWYPEHVRLGFLVFLEVLLFHQSRRTIDTRKASRRDAIGSDAKLSRLSRPSHLRGGPRGTIDSAFNDHQIPVCGCNAAILSQIDRNIEIEGCIMFARVGIKSVHSVTSEVESSLHQIPADTMDLRGCSPLSKPLQSSGAQRPSLLT